MQVTLSSLVRVRVGGELFEILYISNNEIKLYKSDDFVHFIWKQTSDLNIGFTAPQETKKAVNEHAVKIIMPYSVKNSSSEQHRKKSKAILKELQKKSAFLHKRSVVNNWLSSFYRHPYNYFYHNKNIGRRFDILYSNVIHPPIAQLVERMTVEVHVFLSSLVRVRVGWELFDILYTSNNEMKLY